MPLTLADENQNYTIIRIKGKDDVRRHLSNLGLTENETISVKQSIHGNLIVEVKGVRLALNADLAKRIMI